MADIGFIGFGRTRALELPEGDQAPVAPAGRSRIRYDRANGQVQASFDRGPYEAFGAAGGGGTTVANTTELAALDDTTFVNGVNVAVASVRDVFELDKASAVAADGITVVSTASGTGRWVRRELASEVWARQASWFIDAAGDDENGGATAGEALASWAEFARRVGELTMPQATTVTILSDLDEDVFRVRGKHPGSLTVVGATTVVDSGTFTSVQALDSTITPVQEGRVVDGSQDFAPYLGESLVATSGAAAGNHAWVLAVGPGGAGVDTARVGAWYGPGFSTTVPLAGDDYDVVTRVTMTGRWDLATRDVPADGVVIFKDLDIVAPSTISALAGSWGGAAWDRCRIRQPSGGSLTLLSGGQPEFGGVLFDVTRAGWRDAFVQFFACSFRDASVEFWGAASCQFWFNNAFQRVAGGINQTRTQIIANDRARVQIAGFATPLGNSVGAHDLATAGQTLMRTNTGCGVRMATPSKLWTLGQAAGTWGVRLEVLSSLTWPNASVAGDVLDFNGAGNEVELGATTTDAATLGAAGTIDAATNATAVRRALS